MEQKQTVFQKAYGFAQDAQRKRPVDISLVPSSNYLSYLQGALLSDGIRRRNIYDNQNHYCGVYRILAIESVSYAQKSAKLGPDTFFFMLTGYHDAIKEETSTFSMDGIKEQLRSERYAENYFATRPTGLSFTNSSKFFSSMAHLIIKVGDDWFSALSSLSMREVDQPLHVVAHAISALKAVNDEFSAQVRKLSSAD